MARLRRMSEEILKRISPPPAGWSTDYRGNATFVLHGGRPLDFRPPKHEGREPDWVSVFGDRYTRWTYYTHEENK